VKFSIATIAYVFALLAAGMAAFGAWGLVAATAVLAYWAWLYAEPKSNGRSAALLTAVFAIAAILIALLAPVVQSARESARHVTCKNNLRNIALAVINRSLFSTRRDRFLAALEVGGVRMHSWRTMILPPLDQQALFQAYDMTEAWNGPSNGPAVTSSQLMIYQCPSHPTGRIAGTSYFAVVDSRTVWTKEGLLLFRSTAVRDGQQFTILLMEGPEQPWGKPVDLTFEQAVDILCNRAVDDLVGHEIDDGYFYKRRRFVMAAMCDGSVRELLTPMRRELAEALLTASGGEEIDERELRLASAPQLDYETCYAFGAFVALAAAPVFRLRRGQRTVGINPTARFE
jgi:hypothetical protein